MHIAFFSPGWPPATYPNGIVTYVHCMRQELIAQGHRVSVFSGEVDPTLSDPDVHRVSPRLIDRFVRVFSKRVLNRNSADYDSAAILAAAVKRVHAREPVDVIEMEESFGLVADVAEATGIATVCKMHGPTFLTQGEAELETAFSQRKIRLEGAALHRMPVIVAPSRFTLAGTIAHYGLQPKIALQVPNPLPQRANVPLWNLGTCDRNTLLFVGRFDMIKGADVLLRAVARLLVDRPELKLVFVGPDHGLVQYDGSIVHLADFVASLSSPALQRALSYKGRLGAEEIVALRTKAIATIISSRRDNQPFTALEGMVQGCPMVCTDTAGLGEMIEHGATGLKAIPGDAEDLAVQIGCLLDDPELAARLGHNGREYVLKTHAPDVVVEQMLDVYRGAIELHRACATGGR